MAFGEIAGYQLNLVEYASDAALAQYCLHSLIGVDRTLANCLQHHIRQPVPGVLVQRTRFTVEVVNSLQLSGCVPSDLEPARLSVAVFFDAYRATFRDILNVCVVFSELRLATDFNAQLQSIIAPLPSGRAFCFLVPCLRIGSDRCDYEHE